MAETAPTPRPVPEDVAALRQRVADLEAALSAQQHGEQALRAARDTAEQIVATVREPLLILTPDFRVQSANPAFYSLYDLGNRHWDLPALHTLLERIVPDNTVFNDFEVYQDFARIGPRTFLLNARRVEQAQLILLALEDITTRKQAEIHRQQQQTQLARDVQEQTAALHQERTERQRLEHEADQVQHFARLGRLAAGVSHEIRNPLGAIMLHVDLLDEGLRQPSADSAAAMAAALAEIKTQLTRVDDLVQDYPHSTELCGEACQALIESRPR